MKIKFNISPKVGTEIGYIEEVIDSGKVCGDGKYSGLCEQWLKEKTGSAGVLLTTSCTQALEMAAVMADIKPGDEVVLPSFTFVSTANAFALRGAKLVFVDIRPDTMNIDENLIEEAITDKTKAVIPVHYAGVGCEMDKIMELAREYNISVIEDAAQGVMAEYKGRALGSIGDFGCYSFHETKNYSMGEGGAILIGSDGRVADAEIIREKGTDRKKFLRGQVDKYSWVSVGSSYLPSDMNAAYLWAQLEVADKIKADRMSSWNRYLEGLDSLIDSGKIEVQHIPDYCEHNAHMFYIKVKDIEERTELISYLGDKEITAVFHYVPLHSSVAGRKYGRFMGEDRYTTRESERLLRLPMYYGLLPEDVERVTETIKDFYRTK